VLCACEAVLEAEQRQLVSRGSLSAQELRSSTLCLDVLHKLMHRIKGHLSDHEPSGKVYSKACLDKWMRKLDTVERAHRCIQQNDVDFARCVANIAEKIALHNATNTIGETAETLYLACPENTAPDLAALRDCLREYVDLLSGDEKYALIVNIQADLDAGEKPVALGGSFEGNSAIFQQAKKNNAKSKIEHREARRAAQSATKTPSTRISRAASKKALSVSTGVENGEGGYVHGSRRALPIPRRNL